MTPAEIALVQDSWRSILPIRDTFAQLFYAKLFALDPSLRTLFKEDLSEQGRSFVAMVSIAVRNLGEPKTVERALLELGARHARYGVRPEHYETVGVALILTLALSLGETFTSEARAAWERGYGRLTAAMQAVEAPAG